MHVHISYLQYINNLYHYNEYTCEVASLPYLYDQLSHASLYESKQMAGHVAPLMISIFFVNLIVSLLIVFMF